MDIGFGAAVAGAWATPRNLAELGRRAERLGYRSLWTFSRLLAPAAGGPLSIWQIALARTVLGLKGLLKVLG